jgi:hypothetical protein
MMLHTGIRTHIRSFEETPENQLGFTRSLHVLLPGEGVLSCFGHYWPGSAAKLPRARHGLVTVISRSHHIRT